MDQEQNIELSKDKIIQELIALLNQNQRREAANDVLEMAVYIDAMEKKMDAVIQELVDVKKQLAEIEKRQERKTAKEVISGMVEKLETQCQKMKQQLFEVKMETRAKAAEIVAEIKQKGKSALNKVAEFLGIRNKLQNIRQNVLESIAEVDKSIAKIDALGTGMRESIQKAANTIRSFANKQEKEYGEKKFSKTELLKKPLQTKRKLLDGILNYADAAIEKMEKLSADVKQYQSDRADREVKRAAGEEFLAPAVISNVAEQEYQYGAEAFEAQQEKINVAAESIGKAAVVSNNKKSR